MRIVNKRNRHGTHSPVQETKVHKGDQCPVQEIEMHKRDQCPVQENKSTNVIEKNKFTLLVFLATSGHRRAVWLPFLASSGHCGAVRCSWDHLCLRLALAPLWC